jgi:hypothetical protein
MWKKIAVIGGTAAIIGGAGTAAFAASATATPTPSPSSVSPTSVSATSDSSATTSKRQPGKRAGVDRLRRSVHATWVTRNKKTRTFTTHDAIRGQVTAVSPTSITVRAADNLTETYVINSRTKVFTRVLRTAGSQKAVPRTAASIADVKAGDSVIVGGTGTATLTAIRVVDLKKK